MLWVVLLWLLTAAIIAALNFWVHHRRKRLATEQRQTEAKEINYQMQQW